MTATLNSEFLRNCISAYEAATERMEAIVAGLTPEQANFKPGPKKWSIAQCIEHLNISATKYLDVMEPKLKAAREAGKTGSEPYGRGSFIGRFILKNLRQGAKAPKVPAPGTFRPEAGNLDIAKLADDFRAINKRMIAAAESADGLDLGRIRFGTPVFSLARVTMAEAFEMPSLHEPRHLAQAERVKQAEGYPA